MKHTIRRSTEIRVHFILVTSTAIIGSGGLVGHTPDFIDPENIPRANIERGIEITDVKVHLMPGSVTGRGTEIRIDLNLVSFVVMPGRKRLSPRKTRIVNTEGKSVMDAFC
jgi:hypothetical protein